MAREAVPERGALVIGHLYPNTFGWVIKTGRAVDRAALTAACDNVYASDVRMKALSALAMRNLDGEYASYRNLEGLLKATRKALRREKGINHGNDRPKSKDRITAEAVVIHTILRVAAEQMGRS